MRKRSWIPCLVVVSVFAPGCAIKMIDHAPMAEPRVEGLPFRDRLGIDRIELTDDTSEGSLNRTAYESRLASELKGRRIFSGVQFPIEAQDDVDLLLRGTARGGLRPGGLANFLTWFPGPFILMHNWRGTRYVYDAHANVELVDARTGQVLGKYTAQTSYELIHQSSNPGPMVSAAIIIPAVVKGAITVSPNDRYKRLLYEQTYPELWRRIGARMAEDLAPKYAAEERKRRERCGGDLDGPPRVGSSWTRFEDCQRARYLRTAERPGPEGTTTVFQRDDGEVEVYVVDGEIARWIAPDRAPHVAAPPPATPTPTPTP